MSMPNINDWLNSNRGFDGERTPFASWPAVGTRYSGTVTDVRTGPNYEFGTRNIDPQAPTQLIITLQLTEPAVNPQTGQLLVGNVTDPSTNTQRQVPFQPGQQIAIAVKPGSADVETVRSAIQASGARELAIGGHFTITFVAEVPSGKGNPVKKKEATFQPPAPATGAAAWVAAQPNGGYPQQPQPPAQQYPQQPGMPVNGGMPSQYPQQPGMPPVQQYAAQPNGGYPQQPQPVQQYEQVPVPQMTTTQQYVPTAPPGVPGITQ